MPSAIEVVRDHQQHYLSRKLARSPLLHFFPGAYRIDINALFEGIQANLPVTQGTTGVSSPNSLITNLLGSRLDATIHNVRPAMLKRLEKIQKAAVDSRHSTGQHTLYLGYPCVVLPGEAGKTKLAPVFLFAIDLTVTSQKITIKRLIEIGENGSRVPADAIFNRLMADYIDREYGVSLGTGLHEIEINGANIDSEVDAIFAAGKTIRRDFKYPTASSVPDKNQLKLLDRTRDDPSISDYALLGIAEFTGQAMLDDLDKIIKMMEQGTQCPPALASIIEERDSSLNNQGIEPISDKSKWLVEKSDPSQEKVIWARQKNFLTVLQGPPGTGKSQTIVNIVADALAQKKTVLVVCQKRAAIEVVLKRLSAKGLGDIAVLVDDIDKDRLRVIRQIDQIENEFESSIFLEAERARISDEIQLIEVKIDKAIAALNDKKDGARIRYGDIKTLLKRLTFLQPSDEWTPALKNTVVQYLNGGIDQVQLDEFFKNTKELDKKAGQLSYGKNLWSETFESLADSPRELEDIINAAQTANLRSKEFSTKVVALQHDSTSHWVAAHPWLQGQNPSFQTSGLLDSKEARQHYSKFQHWLRAVSEIAVFNPNLNTGILVNSLLNDGLDLDYFQRLEDDSRYLRELIRLRADIQADSIWNSADIELKHKRGDWASDIYAIALHKWGRELLVQHTDGFSHAPNISSLIKQLGDRLKRKRQLDSLNILGGFRLRVATRNELKDKNLLRLRAGSGIPKTSLRNLYSKGLGELKEISPLLLVSPETASSMLPLRSGLFDVVVIDEASQMFVAEAIPMLFRGKQAVIAGDNQQMPPADFFSYSDDEEESYEEIEADESDGVMPQLIAADRVYPLLEAAENALPAGGHSRLRLEVHYRSARRELIDFSNHAFYEGKLIIPSGNAKLPSFMKTAIEFEAIEGHFTSGLNDIEAKRIVELVRNIWAMPEVVRPTVGVIVANTKQRDRVRELLQDVSDRDERLRQVYEREFERTVDGEDVSFFIRSVEHVQGDERDLIIFALTYSGDSRAFGPLNAKNDGRKRLNVAVTRSKLGMIVLSSLNISHISNLTEKGLHERYYVWQYLRYAKAVAQNDYATIESVLNQLNEQRLVLKQKSEATESPFEDEVKQFIESLGFYVECQIGESGFRIDLGIRGSQNSHVYLCGVECDGARYHSGWRARTNDVWRQEILESKGWKIIRVWSTNWFDRPEETQKELAGQLKNLRTAADSENSEIRYQFIRRPPTVSPTQANETDVSGHNGSPPHQQVVSNSEAGGDTVELGDTVIYKYLHDGKIASARIINGQSNPNAGTINALTPLAKSILGAAEGEEVSFLSPGGEVRLLIEAIEKS